MKIFILIALLGLIAELSFAQTADSVDTKSFGNRIFLPALEIGYVHNNSESLSGGLMIKTSIEYRLQNNNDVFFRLNYDTYDTKYALENANGLTNVLKGTAFFSDLILGGGYRFGERATRFFVLVQPGIKFYDYPIVTQENAVVNINQEAKHLFTSRLTLGMEYYINNKSAFSVDIFQNQVWQKQDFWNENSGAFGLSIGFITALF